METLKGVHQLQSEYKQRFDSLSQKFKDAEAKKDAVAQRISTPVLDPSIAVRSQTNCCRHPQRVTASRVMKRSFFINNYFCFSHFHISLKEAFFPKIRIPAL